MSEPFAGVDSEAFKRVVNFICDPSNGASVEKCEEMRAHLAKPEIARAFHRFLTSRDLHNFSMSGLDRLPLHIVAGMRKHFPERF